MDWASLILRLGLGIMFMAHGLQKAFGLFSGPGMQGFTKMLAGLGFVPAGFWAYIGAYTELLGGAFLILGLFTRGSAALLLVFMLVAILKVHLSKGFFLSSGGFEYPFIIICSLAALLILGGGKFALKISP